MPKLHHIRKSSKNVYSGKEYEYSSSILYGKSNNWCSIIPGKVAGTDANKCQFNSRVDLGRNMHILYHLAKIKEDHIRVSVIGNCRWSIRLDNF
jgi:hypothetical protein